MTCASNITQVRLKTMNLVIVRRKCHFCIVNDKCSVLGTDFRFNAYLSLKTRADFN